MRLLLAVHNCYTDPTSGAARSIRTIVEWLAAAGHECRVISTARFDAKAPDNFQDHLGSLEVSVNPISPPTRLIRSGSVGRTIYEYVLKGVRVWVVDTRHNDYRFPDRDEFEQITNLIKWTLKDFQPDVVLTYGAHPVVQEAMKLARQRGAKTVFSVRNYGYEDPRWFRHADYVLTCSPYLSRYYNDIIGLQSEGIVSPIDWNDVLSGDDCREFVTFVNPSLAKGAALFARLADMLGSQRPDIPVLVVQSAADASSLNSIPGIDFSKYPQIMAAPAVPRPADFFEITKILLAPSVFAEPFGRVAAEALINGVPPVVSNRGSLPDTVGEAGIVLPIPEWITPKTIDIPSEQETQPWFDAVCELWDDNDYYNRLSDLGRETAQALYSESSLKERYFGFFEKLEITK